MPLFGQPDEVPWQGSEPETRVASLSGAVHAAQNRSTKVQELRRLIGKRGPLTLNQMAEKTGWPLSSICSLHAMLKPELQVMGHETVKVGAHTTYRTRWALKGTR